MNKKILNWLCVAILATMALHFVSCDEKLIDGTETEIVTWDQFPLPGSSIDTIPNDSLIGETHYCFDVPAQGGDYTFNLKIQPQELAIYSSYSFIATADKLILLDSLNKENNEYLTIATRDWDGNATNSWAASFTFSFKPNTSGDTRCFVIRWSSDMYRYFSRTFVFYQESE